MVRWVYTYGVAQLVGLGHKDLVVDLLDVVGVHADARVQRARILAHERTHLLLLVDVARDHDHGFDVAVESALYDAREVALEAPRQQAASCVDHRRVDAAAAAIGPGTSRQRRRYTI